MNTVFPGQPARAGSILVLAVMLFIAGCGNVGPARPEPPPPPDDPVTVVNPMPDPAPDCTGDSCADPGSGFVGETRPMHGVAFDAQLFSVGFSTGEPPDSYIPVDLYDPQIQADDLTVTAFSGTIEGIAQEDVPAALESLSGRASGNDLFVGFHTHPGWRFGLHGAGLIAPDTFTDDAAFANPFLALSRNGAVAGISTHIGQGALRVAAFHGTAQYGERRDPDTGRSGGALLEYRFAPGARSGVALQAGWLREAERLAGSRPSGAFGELDADAGFLGFAAHRRIGARWTALISAHGGMSRAGAQSQGSLHDLSALWTSAFGVGLIGKGIGHAHGRLALRVSQPLRVEAGAAWLRWPSDRSRDRQALLQETRLGLTPSGRQLDLELGWSRPWQGGHAYLAALGSRDAGHIRGASDFALLLRYRRGF